MRMRFVLSCLLCLGFLVHLRAEEPPPGMPLRLAIQPPVADSGYCSLAVGVYASGLGDWVTTRQFRQDGVEEANPLLGSMADSTTGLAAVKLGGGTLVNYIAYNLKKDGKRYWKVPQIVWIALNVAASLHNSNSRP